MDRQRALSLIISGIYLLLAFMFGGAETAFLSLIFLVIALALIWFGDELGGYTGFSSGFAYINRKTPGPILQFVGWMLLFVPVIIGIFHG